MVGKWQISSHVQGTYDTVYLYLVSGNKNLDEYNNLVVNFSGKVYSIQSEKMPVVSAGTECFCLLLETITVKPWNDCYPALADMLSASIEYKDL